MITSDPTREMPVEWTNDLLIDLWDHARDLGHNGNPGGYILTKQLFPFVGYERVTGSRHLKHYDDWDYDGMRQWISENRDEVKISWQRVVRSEY